MCVDGILLLLYNIWKPLGGEFMPSSYYEESLRFDDVLLVPQYSEVLPKDVDISTKLTKD